RVIAVCYSSWFRNSCMARFAVFSSSLVQSTRGVSSKPGFFGLASGCLASTLCQINSLNFAHGNPVTHDGLPFPLTESDTPLLREPCPHTRWSGLQIHCKREGPHEVRSAERIRRKSSSLYARSSPGRGVAAGYTGAKRASSLASALL